MSRIKMEDPNVTPRHSNSPISPNASSSSGPRSVASPVVTTPFSAATSLPSTSPQQVSVNGAGQMGVNPKREHYCGAVEPGALDHDGQHQEEPNVLEQLALEKSPEVLEEAVRKGMGLIDHIKFALNSAASSAQTSAPAWLKVIHDLEARSQPPKTIVGVVGNTGAGKSSVINALLDEERLLPTNCLRACTASPTEISYNTSDNPAELYRAEIEFISADDWMKELKTLFTDLLDDSGHVSRECTNPDTEAGIAYAKIRSVYPSKTREMIAVSSPERLANEPDVRGVLGSVKKLRATAAKDLYVLMQRYVDSKEKNSSGKKDPAMEFWPLIKVVRIYTKAKALSTGAVIVDLPGVQDSNAARAAVAKEYMKACTGLWIVAPITRAVDDKTAKTLLGDSFKRQLKYDGIFSAVTFICSKTDDISVTEAAESLEIEADISDSWAKIESLRGELRHLKSLLAERKDEKTALLDRLEQIDSEWEKWDDLSQKHTNDPDRPLYAPADKSNKRKRGSTSSRSRKDRTSSDSDDSDSDDSELDSDADKENNPDNENRQPLTEEQIQDELTSLKGQRKDVRVKRKEVDAVLADLRGEIKSVQSEEQRLLGAVKAICIQGRNGYSKGAIQRDFAMGTKELDQEAAIEENEATFDPDEDIRDYDEVARNLPVFCVSSRAYQKMRGRLRKDDFNNDGFRSVDETEVPQLQQHAKKLTESGRAANSRRFLNELSQLLNSLKMWAINDGTQSRLSESDQQREERHLRLQLTVLERDFSKAVDECVGSIKDALAESIYDYFEMTIPAASDAAVPTAMAWGAPRNEGGLFWATYKATCRRSGVYSGCSGHRDFNAELFEPITRQLASGWERAFQRRLPQALEGFAVSARSLLDNFHRSAIAQAEGRGSNFAGINMLSQQLRTHTTRLKEIPALLRTSVQELQREASRGFTPVITQDMQPGYDICVEERGPGSFARMKSHMVDHVENTRHTMFRHSTDSVKEQLQELCRRVENDLATQVQEIYNLLTRDYLAVLVGVDTKVQPRGLPRAERMLRLEMLEILQRANEWFETSVPVKEQKQIGDVDHVAEEDESFADEDGRSNVDDDRLAGPLGHETDLVEIKNEPVM